MVDVPSKQAPPLMHAPHIGNFWYNGYCDIKGNRQWWFKFWVWLLAVYFTLMSAGKSIIEFNIHPPHHYYG